MGRNRVGPRSKRAGKEDAARITKYKLLRMIRAAPPRALFLPMGYNCASHSSLTLSNLRQGSPRSENALFEENAHASARLSDLHRRFLAGGRHRSSGPDSCRAKKTANLSGD